MPQPYSPGSWHATVLSPTPTQSPRSSPCLLEPSGPPETFCCASLLRQAHHCAFQFHTVHRFRFRSSFSGSHRERRYHGTILHTCHGRPSCATREIRQDRAPNWWLQIDNSRKYFSTSVRPPSQRPQSHQPKAESTLTFISSCRNDSTRRPPYTTSSKQCSIRRSPSVADWKPSEKDE